MSWVGAAVAAFGALAGTSVTSHPAVELPDGWKRSGSHARAYDAAPDEATKRDGRSTLRLASEKDVPGFGTIMRSEPAAPYVGKTLRLSAAVRAEGVGAWAGLWMRVDGEPGRTLAFDNMQSRPILGTADWRRYEVILPIAPEARTIAYGLLLSGAGTVWLDEVALDVVPDETPPTAPPRKALAPPTNLGFEE